MLFGSLIVATSALVTLQAWSSQLPFPHEGGDPIRHEFDWPIKNVAIIGAGVSGMMAYKALLDEDAFDGIKIFERDNQPGGNWHYTDETAPDTNLVAQSRSDWWTDDYEPTLPLKVPLVITYNSTRNKSLDQRLEHERKVHRQPKPVYRNLRANTPAPEQQIADFPWPKGVEWETHHKGLQRYLRAFASWLGVNVRDEDTPVSYNTRVEAVSKRIANGRQKGWTLLLRRFAKLNEGQYEESWWEEAFDAVVVASGRFNVPWLAPIHGLADYQSRHPERVFHSRQYRNPEDFKNQTVLVLGASASAVGIAGDLDGWTNRTYLSVRENSDDPRAPVLRALHLASVPANTTIIGEISAFSGDDQIKLLNGSVISGIDSVILGTGYRYAFPFLSQYHLPSTHNSSTDLNQDGEAWMVTDGTHVRSLYKDTFYIDQPTLAFQGLNVGIQTFVYGKYTATAIARVWRDHADLPSRQAMRRDYRASVKERGERKGLQWLTAEASKRNLEFFITWLNDAATKYGDTLLDLPRDVSEISNIWRKARGILGGKEGQTIGHDLLGGVNGHSLLRVAADDW